MGQPDKFWMFIEIIPRPLVYIKSEQHLADLSDATDLGNLRDDKGLSQTNNDAIMNVEPKRTCLAFEVEPQYNLFFFGKTMKVSDAISLPDPLSIFFPCPCEKTQDTGADNNGGGKQECGTEIRLSYHPWPVQTERLKHELRDKQNKSAKHSYWKKIVRRCLEPFKHIFDPFGHSSSPNAVISGGEVKHE